MKLAEERKWFLASIRWLPWLLLFLSYPVSLVIPVRLGVPLLFHFQVPSFLLLSVLSIAWLGLNPPVWNACPPGGGRRRYYYGVLAAVVVGCSLSAWLGRTASFVQLLRFAGYFAVPLYFATCPRTLLSRRIPEALGLLWLVNTLHGLWQVKVGFLIVGLGGNPNWFAPVIAATAPWAVYACLRLLQKRRSRAGLGRGARLLAVSGLGLLVGGLTLFLVGRTGCRATWLALAAYMAVYGLLLRMPRRIGGLLAVLALVAAFTLTLRFGDRVATAVEKDIRIPLWAQTVRLSLDHPLLGVGPGNFRREFAGYRSAAQKARAVAAAVTEHPHNEILHVFATLGFPLGVAWVLLWYPAVRPFRRRGQFGLMHFSVFVILVHGLFDKVLVQPPGNLLGFCLLGLLWRPRLKWRALPARRPGWPGRFSLAVGILALMLGSAMTIWQLWTGMLLRRAYLHEMREDFHGAYDAYAKAAKLDPTNVRTHAYAGICANNKLRNPRLALLHLEQAYRLEPSFAHVNGEIGLALGSLGENRGALMFFEREARLYPFDAGAHQQLLTCRIINGRTEGILELVERIGDLRYRRVSQQLGDGEVVRLSREWLAAVKSDDAQTAIAAAAKLVGHLRPTGAEPGFRQLAEASGVPLAFRNAAYTELDCRYWREQIRLHGLLGGGNRTPEQLVELAMQAMSGVSGIDPTPADAYAALAQAAGYHTAILEHDGRPAGVVELWNSEGFWLVRPETGAVGTGADWKTRAGAVGLPGEDSKAWPRLLPVSPLDFCIRTQALAQILARALPSRAVPNFVQSPAVRLFDYHARLTAEHGTADIGFDLQPWKAFGQ